MTRVIALAGGLFVLLAPAHTQAANEPLRQPSGDPVCAMYFFPHWWEPWRSQDEAVRADLETFKAHGVNTLLVDHEWSQAIDSEWKWLDRAHRLASEQGLAILPWLSLKTWSDMGSDPARIDLVKRQYGVDLILSVDQSGQPSTVLVYDEATIEAGYRYAKEYVERYLENGALMRVIVDGAERPVVALSVEVAWTRGGFDERTNALFREWLADEYASVETLNEAWGADYGAITEVDPRDKSVFDYEGHVAETAAHPQAVEDHVEFRAQLINQGLTAVKARLLSDFPDLLIAAELPYQLASQHPHARSFRIDYGSTPSAVAHADILFLRMTGPLSESEATYLDDYIERTGQRVILCYRTYSDWGTSLEGYTTDELAGVYASGAAQHAHGVGFYSWNECVDVHLTAPGEGSPDNDWAVPPDQAARMQSHAWRIVELFREMVE